MPEELNEIQAKLAAQPLNKKQLKKLARAQNLETSPPVLPATIGAPSVEAARHREKVAPAGDQMDPLIAWYSLVAKPITRKLWAPMPKAQAAVYAEWCKL